MKQTSFAALVLLTACAPAPTREAPSASPAPATAAAAALNPVGIFQFTTSDGGETVSGSIEVTGQTGAYGGHIRTPNDVIVITSVAVTGQQMVVTGDTPGGTLTLTLNFTGNDFTGGWVLAGVTGEMRGQRTS
jgi:hypothetical protein